MAEADSTLFDMGEPLKRCPHCKTAKPLAAFTEFIDKRNGHHRRASYCRPCQDESRKAWNARNPMRVTEWNLRSALAEYGLTLEAYNALAASQGGLCAICKRPPRQKPKGRGAPRLYVDHDHVSGAVRGLLCSQCNAMLGHAQDNPAILQAAIDYLRR